MLHQYIKWLRNRVLLFVIFSLLAQYAAAQVRINEIIAQNASLVYDPDFGEFSDFIELYNTSQNAVNIKDYSISDDSLDTRKWVFPNIELKAGAYLLLWADGEDKIVGASAFCKYRNATIITESFHLNFSLSSAGEYVGLYNTNGILVDEIEFGAQLPDVSFGRNPIEPEQWQFFGEATPGSINSNIGATHAIYGQNPTFSISGGFYSGEQLLDITVTNPNTEIRFTFDGSSPTNQSPLFVEPFPISRNLTIKARLYESGKLPGPIITHTYFINETINLPVVSVSTSSTNLWDFDFGLFQNSIKEREIPATIEYFDTSGQKTFTEGAGLRIFGSTIYSLPQKPMSIRFKSKYGNSELNYPLFENRERLPYKSFMLRNGGNDHNLAFFRDGLAVSMVKNKMDLDFQDYKPSVVFINGEYWGIYDIRERLDEDYINQNHQVNPNNLDFLEDSLLVSSGSADGYRALTQFIESHDLQQTENYDYVSSKIDINEYLNYVIHKIFIGYRLFEINNKYWCEKEQNGRWRWIASDMEHAFGQLGGDNYWENTLEKVSGETNDLPPWSTFLFKQLLQNNKFRDAFIQRFAVYLNTIYKPEITVAMVDSLQLLLQPQMPRHINKWKTPINTTVWNGNIQLIREFLQNRPSYMRQHIAEQFGVEDSTQLKLCIIGRGKVLVSGTWLNDSCNSGYFFKNTGIELHAVPEVGYRFVGWQGVNENDAEFTLTLLNDTNLTALFELQKVSIIPAVIESDTLLSAELSPWYALGDVTIKPGATLTIEAGAELLMSDKASIYVNGGLNIKGDIHNQVTIKPNPSPIARKPFNNKAPRWGVICAINATDTLRIDYAEISGSGFGIDREKQFASLTSLNSNIIINNTYITDNIQPFYSEFGSIYIGNSKFRCSMTCDLINIKYSIQTTVENCDLMGNKAVDTDAIDYDGVINGIIHNNKIYGFWGDNSDAIDLGEGSQNVLIENNVFFDCTDKAISVGQGSTVQVKRNLIYDCDMGVAVKDSNSFAVIDQNTFYATNHGVACYEKNTSKGGGRAEVKNSILAGSLTSPVLVDERSFINVTYSISDTDSLQGNGNLHADPEFIAASRANFQLQTTSPCIDGGDPQTELDPDQSRADMGAYYTHSGSTGVAILINEINYHSPSNYETGDWIEILNTSDSSISLNGWKIKDRINYFEINSPIVLNPNEYLIVCEDIAQFKKFHPDIASVIGDLNFGLNNKKEQIRILDEKNNVVHSVIYKDNWPWPPLADGKGATMELEHKKEGNYPEDWRESYILMGTPGSSNSLAPTIESIYINELMAKNQHTIADEFGEFDDWFELYNANDTAVNLGGLYLTGNLSNPGKYQLPLNYPELTTIEPNGFLTVWADNQPEQGILHLNFRLSADGEEIGIFQRRLNQFLQLNSIFFGQQTNIYSFGRYPDGSENWNFLSPTPGISNQLTHITQKNAAKVLVYPNPFDEYAIFYAEELPKPFTIQVSDLTGKTIRLIQNCHADEFMLERENLNAGVYLYKIICADGIHASGKLIVFKQ